MLWLLLFSFGLLVGLKHEVIESCRGIDKILLRELARNYREGDGDCGICFEYAVHSAIRNNNPLVIERIQEALYCVELKEEIRHLYF